MRASALFLLLAGCGGGGAQQASSPGDNVAAAREVRTVHVPTAAEIADMRAASATLRLYYDHIGRGDYRAAWALREQRPGLAFEAFARSFAGYADYHADVGTSSYPAESEGIVWIDAPVQTWGRQRSGAPFGSVGRVLLKRQAGSREWKIAP